MILDSSGSRSPSRGGANRLNLLRGSMADIEITEPHDMVAGFELGDADEFTD
jgi:hypothetical protein